MTGHSESICRKCVHSYVCERFNQNRDSDNQKCHFLNDHFVPTIEAEPVRHGRWVGLEYDGYADGFPVYDLWECSECGEEVRGEDVPDTHPYCHGCGAKMDGDSHG